MISSLPTPFDDAGYRVVGRAAVTGSIVELRLEPVGERIPPWRPGQYVLLGDAAHAVPVRSYSIANAAGADGRVRLLVTRVPQGGLSTWVHDGLRVGEQVLLSGPYGVFGAGIGGGADANANANANANAEVDGDADADTPVLCLAGGSGIAPMLAFAEDAVQRGVPGTFAVLFSARTAADVIDAPRWRAWAQRYPRLHFERTLTRQTGEPPSGRIPRILAGLYPDLSRHDVYIAGDPGFVRDCARAARERGARPGHVHTEEFFAEPQPWGAADVEASR